MRHSNEPNRDGPTVSSGSMVRRSIAVGLVVGLIPVVFFSATILPVVMRDGDPQRLTFVLIFIGLASLFLGVPAAVLALLFQRGINSGSKSLDEEYRNFAQRVDGEAVFQKVIFGLTLPKAVLFHHRDVPAVLDLPWQGQGSGKRTFVRLTFELPREQELSCDVCPAGMFEFLGSFVGARDTQLGWEVFDDQFSVKSNDAADAAIVFDRPVQELLLEFKAFADLHVPRKTIGSGYFDLSLSGNRLQLRMQGMLLKEEHLMAFYQACGRIYDSITVRLPGADHEVKS